MNPGEGIPIVKRQGTGNAMVKLIVGVAFCASAFPFFGVVVAGWLMRLMRRSTRRQWLELAADAGAAEKLSESEIDEVDRVLLRGWPNWFVARRVAGRTGGVREAGEKSRWRAWLLMPVGSFAENLRLGALGLMNAWIVTLPAGALWAFSWFAGWNNSFHKGYEQAAIGPMTGILGVGLFIAAMSYVPLAQARQASTGEWRSFYDFGLIRRIMKAERLGCLGLAGCYSLFGAIVMVLTIVPGFLEGINPAILEYDREELLGLARRYYLAVAAMGFAALIVLRTYAARIYARGFWKCRYGAECAEMKSGASETRFLAALNLSESVPESDPSPIVLRIWRGLSLPLRLAAPMLAAAFWFAVVAQIYVAQFLYFRPLSGWLNHPLIQLPRFFYLPPGFRDLP